MSVVGAPVQEGGKPGQYLKPSQMFSVSSTSKDPALAARMINFLVRAPEGARLLGLDRGVPASPEIREAIMPDLSETSRKVVELISSLTPHIGALPPSPPKGAGEINAVQIRISQEVGFEAVSPEQGGASLVDEAAAILKRA